MNLKSVALLALLGFSLAVNAAEPPQVGPFATGQLNTVTNKFFSGKSYLQSLNSQEVRVSNVTDKRAGSPSIYWREECEQKIVKMM